MQLNLPIYECRDGCQCFIIWIFGVLNNIFPPKNVENSNTQHPWCHNGQSVCDGFTVCQNTRNWCDCLYFIVNYEPQNGTFKYTCTLKWS